MKKLLLATAALVALPVMAQAQMAPTPGFYIGGAGGLNWMFNSTIDPPGILTNINLSPQIGWAAGGMIGYDFVGPRLEVEGMYRQNNANVNFSGVGGGFAGFGVNIQQITIMANLLYDFNFGSPIVPYIGAGAGVAFINASAFGTSSDTTQFAYQGILGLGYRIDDNRRINLEAATKYDHAADRRRLRLQNNVSLMASISTSSARRRRRRRRRPHGRAAVVHGVLRLGRSNLSQQALNTIKQAAAAFKSKGNARITATGHTDTSVLRPTTWRCPASCECGQGRWCVRASRRRRSR